MYIYIYHYAVSEQQPQTIFMVYCNNHPKLYLHNNIPPVVSTSLCKVVFVSLVRKTTADGQFKMYKNFVSVFV